MGINVDGIISVTFAIGAALAGAAGVLYAIAFQQVYFFMGIIPGLKPLSPPYWEVSAAYPEHLSER